MKAQQKQKNEERTRRTVKSIRSKGLRRIGVTEDDVTAAEMLLRQVPSQPTTKLERTLGYSIARLRRVKALRILGACEEDIDEEFSKCLSSLGKSGRRRSFRYSSHRKASYLFSQLQQ